MNKKLDHEFNDSFYSYVSWFAKSNYGVHQSVSR